MALAMFVGCDNAPVIPSFVVGGNIEQTGDFLIGQAFDPGKFSVTVTYDNGRIVPAEDTVNVRLVKGSTTGKVGIVELGDTVVADLGIVYDTEKETVTAAIQVYPVDHIVVTGPETLSSTVENADDFDKADFLATAYYYGEDRTALSTMPLTSSEWTFGDIHYENGVKPSVKNPEVNAWFDITSSLADGNVGRYEFVSTFQADGEITAEDIQSIASVKYNGYIAAWTYAETPQVNFDDVEIEVVLWKDYVEGELEQKTTTLTSDPGIELTFVDNVKKLPLQKTKFSTSDQYFVKAELEGLEPVYSDAGDEDEGQAYEVQSVKVEITPAEGFDATKEVIPYADPLTVTPDPEDFVVEYKIGDTWYRVDGSDDSVKVELKYYKTGSGEPSGFGDGNVAVYAGATVNGVRSESNVAAGTVDFKPATPVAKLQSISAVVAPTYVAPAKMVEYTEEALEAITAPTSGSVVVTATYDIGEPKTVTATSVSFSTSTASIVAPVATSFSGETPLYLYVTYAEGGATKTTTVDISDILSVAYPTDIEAAVTYEKAMTNSSSTPMAGAGIELIVKSVNNSGDIAILDESEYEIIVNNYFDNDFDPSTSKVDDKQHKFKVSAELATTETTSKFFTSDEVTVVAGLSWIDYDPETDTLQFALAEGYDNRIGKEILGLGNAPAKNYVVVADSYEAMINKGSDEAPVIDITEVSVINKFVEAENNEVLLTLSWTGKDGETETAQKKFTFAGEAWIESDGFTVTYKDVVYSNAAANFPAGYGIAVSDFVVTPSSYENHGNTSLPTVTMIEVNDNPEYQYAPGQTFDAAGAGITLDITISYDDGMSDTLSTATLRVTTASV